MTKPYLLPRILSNVGGDDAGVLTEGDCACAEPVPGYVRRETPTLESHSRWGVTPNLLTRPLAEDWRLAFQPLAAAGPAVLNLAALRVLAFFATPRRIDEAVAAFADEWDGAVTTALAREMAACQFLAPDGILPAINCSTGRTLTAWLHITNVCNLRCSYCYLPRTNEAMSQETGQRAVEAALRSARRNAYARVKLKYSGGEPLINLPLVLQLHQHARRMAEREKLEVDGVVLSNGTMLTRESVEQLKANGLRLMVSLDGVGAEHDAQRPLADGRGSLARVTRGIDLALTRGLVPHISITVSARNLSELPDTVGYCLERNLPFSLNFYRENDCSGSQPDLQLDAEQAIPALTAALRRIEAQLPQRSLLGGLADRASFLGLHNYPCGAGRDYLVIDPQGRISKCQMKMDEAVTDVQAEDPLRVLRADRHGILNVSVQDKAECRTCTWKYWCAGGCPLAAYRQTGRYDVASPLCSIYRAIYPQVLRLEGLRLLRQQHA